MSPLLYCIQDVHGLPAVEGKNIGSLTLPLNELGNENIFLQKGLFSDQVYKILELLDKCGQESEITEACKYAMNVTFPSMKEKFSRTIRKLELTKAVNDVKLQLLLQALQQMKNFLKAIEMVLTDTDPSTTKLLANLVNSVGSQIDEEAADINDMKHFQKRDGSCFPSLYLSPLRSPSLVFDVAVANLAVWNNRLQQPKKVCEIQSGLAAATMIPEGKMELPLQVEVRTIATFGLEYRDDSTDSTKLKLANQDQIGKQQTYRVNILRCIHVASKQHSFEKGQSDVVGDVTLLVSLRPVGNHTTLASPVKLAQVNQVNASSSSFDETLDIFSSTSQADGEVTILVRFQTRACFESEYPIVSLQLSV